MTDSAIIEPLLLYITAKDREEAHSIARALLDKRLIACANITAAVDSLYWWQGTIAASSEALLLAKTVKSKLEPAIALVKNLHSYECPCVVALPLAGGNSEFLQWVNAQACG